MKLLSASTLLLLVTVSVASDEPHLTWAAARVHSTTTKTSAETKCIKLYEDYQRSCRHVEASSPIHKPVIVRKSDSSTQNQVLPSHLVAYFLGILSSYFVSLIAKKRCQQAPEVATVGTDMAGSVLPKSSSFGLVKSNVPVWDQIVCSTERQRCLCNEECSQFVDEDIQAYDATLREFGLGHATKPCHLGLASQDVLCNTPRTSEVVLASSSRIDTPQRLHNCVESPQGPQALAPASPAVHELPSKHQELGFLAVQENGHQQNTLNTPSSSNGNQLINESNMSACAEHGRGAIHLAVNANFTIDKSTIRAIVKPFTKGIRYGYVRHPL